MPEMAGALCGGDEETLREMHGAVAWCFTCKEYRAHYWVVSWAFDGYVMSGGYRCDRCDGTASDFHGTPRYNLEAGR